MAKSESLAGRGGERWSDFGDGTLLRTQQKGNEGLRKWVENDHWR